jgi:hypothetical protein
VARWVGSSSSPQKLTLLAGAANNTEEDGWGRGRGASSLQNLPLESRAIPATEMRKAEAGEGGRRRKAGQSIYQKHSDAQMIWWLTTTCRQWRGGAKSIRMKNNLFSPFNLQSNFVSCISPSTVIQILWYLFLNFQKSTSIHLWHFFICNSISWMLFIRLILFLISTT